MVIVVAGDVTVIVVVSDWFSVRMTNFNMRKITNAKIIEIIKEMQMILRE